VIPKSTTVAYWQRVGEGVQQAAQEDPNITVTYEGPSDEGDIEGQLRFIEGAIARQPDALVVAPSGGAETQPALQRAVDAGIPVVLLDTDIPEFTAKSAFVGTDNRAGGRIAGEYIAEQLGGSGNVAIIRGRAGDPVGNARTEGAQTAMEEAGLNIVAIQPADWVRDKGQSVAENLIIANPDLKAIFANNDEMALGAAQAALAAGRDDLIIVGFDAAPDALQAVEDGRLDATVAQFPKEMGRLGVLTAAQAARGQEVEEFVNTGAELVTQENVSEFQQE
jgi:ribose transport system substrate-binding protein